MYFFSRPIGEISRKCRGSNSRIGSNSQRVSITSALAPSKDTMLPEWRACLCITAIRSKRPNAAWAERYRPGFATAADPESLAKRHRFGRHPQRGGAGQTPGGGTEGIHLR